LRVDIVGELLPEFSPVIAPLGPQVARICEIVAPHRKSVPPLGDSIPVIARRDRLFGCLVFRVIFHGAHQSFRPE
jgi:hypothetical protein